MRLIWCDHITHQVSICLSLKYVVNIRYSNASWRRKGATMYMRYTPGIVIYVISISPCTLLEFAVSCLDFLCIRMIVCDIIITFELLLSLTEFAPHWLLQTIRCRRNAFLDKGRNTEYFRFFRTSFSLLNGCGKYATEKTVTNLTINIFKEKSCLKSDIIINHIKTVFSDSGAQ